MAHPLEKVVQHIRRVAASQGATDGELLRSFVTSDDQRAFAALVKRHGPLVFAVCKRVLGNVEDAEDSFQAAFVVLARNAAKLPRRCSLSTWLHGVAFKIALNSRRLLARRRRHERQTKTMAATNPALNAAWREVQLLLDEEVQRLPEKYREPFILCSLEGQSYATAAQRMGVKESTVHGRLAEARKRLQTRLSRRGVELTAVLGAAALSHNAATAQVAPALVAKAVAAATGATVPASVTALVKGLTVSLAIKKAKVGMALFVMFSAMVGTASMWAVQEGGQEKAPRAPRKQEAAVTTEPAVAKDIYGDPLPNGAVARMGTLRFRHPGFAMALAFSADGKTLAGRTKSGVIIWDATTGREHLQLPVARAPGRTGSMDISPDGTILATIELGLAFVGKETECTLWDLRTGKKTVTISVPKGKLREVLMGGVGFTPDGRSLALVANGGKVVVVDVPSGQVRASFGGLESSFYNLAVSPDSKTLAMTADDANQSVQLWDIATGKLIRAIQRQPAGKAEGYLTAIAFSPDGKVLAFCNRSRIFLSDRATGKELRQLEPMPKSTGKQRLAFTPDGNRLISVQESECKVFVWDLATGKLLHTIDGRHKGLGLSMALAPDGKTIALGTIGPAVQLWDVATGKELFTEFEGHDYRIFSLAFSRDGKALASAGYRQIFFWDTEHWQPRRALAADTLSLSFSPDGTQLATGSPFNDDLRLQLWNTATNKETLAIKVPDVATSITFAPDGRKLFTLNLQQGQPNQWRVRHWSLANGKQEKEWMLPQQEAPIYLTPDGKTAFAATLNGGIRIHDLESGRERLLPGPGGERVTSLMPSPEGWVLATGTADPNASILLWELLTGKEIFRSQRHVGPVVALAWSPDGRLVASGDECANRYEPTDTQSIRIWDRASGKEVASFGGFKSDVTTLSFSPDGTHLVAGLTDSTILVWKVPKAAPRLMSEFSKTALESQWADLADADAGKAQRALWKLIGTPQQSTSFLRDSLRPVVVADAGKIEQWIADLDSDKFSVRQAAAKELEKVGGQVRPFIQDTLKGNVTLESRRRLEQILNVVSDTPSPETLRTIRAIMALERIGSADAQAVLRTLAAGAPGARETEEAKASLERLAQRPARAP